MDRKPMQMGRDMQNYYYAMQQQEKGSMYQGAGLPAGGMPGAPGIPASLGGSSMQGLSSLGYGPPPPQQSSINPGVPASQTSALQQHPSASPFSSAMPGGPGSQGYPSVSYAQSPYGQATQPAMAMYQSPLAYSQATMAAHNSAAAYMAAAAGAQSASAAYGYHGAPGAGQLYYPGQPMYASPPGGMQPGLHHPHMQQGLNPSMPPAYHPGAAPFRLP